MTTKQTTVVLNLERPARKAGGDRYAGKLLGKDWQVYLPQEITRPVAGTPLPTLILTISVPPKEAPDA